MEKIIPRFEFLEHPAELKIRAFGKNLSELFINATLGMMEYLYGQAKGEQKKGEHIMVEAEDPESLLIEWLSEILWQSDTKKQAYYDINIEEITDKKIKAKAYPINAIASNEIKAVTFHELSIKKSDDLWQATVVFDI